MPEHAREVEAIRSAKTLAELQAVVNGFPAEAAGDGGVLYSRPVGTMQSQLIALEVAKQTGLQIIDDTPRAKFLVFAEKEIKKAAERIFIGNGYSIEETEIKTSGFLYGDVNSPPGSPTSLEGSLWGRASDEFSRSLRGPVVLVASQANAERVFGRVELRNVVNNGDVPTLAGIDVSELRTRFAAGGPQAVLPEVQAQFVRAVDEGVFYVPPREGGQPGHVILSREYAQAMGINPHKLLAAHELHNAGLPLAPTELGSVRPQWAAMQPEWVTQSRYPGLERIAGLGALAGAGAILDGLEVARTADRIGALLDQDNPLAARAELREYAGRKAFVWGGTAVTASVVGTGSVPQVTLLAADAWLLSLAAERGMQWLENRDIVNQTMDGIHWRYDGRLWKREGPVDDTLDGIDNVRDAKVTANLDQSRRLSYLASGVATALAMGDAPTPRNPFVLPAAGMGPGLQGATWERDPATGHWSRQTAVAYDVRDMPSSYQTVPATPEQAAQLDAIAAAIIRDNVAKGPAGIAVHYDNAYRRGGWSQYGPMPEPVRSALESADRLQASNGTVYQRQDDGQWLGQRGSGAPAPPGIHAELEYTRQALQNHLHAHARALAQEPVPVERTADQQRQEHLAYLYRVSGVELHPHELAGIDAAIRRTQEEHGIGLGVLQIKREPGTALGVDSPIAHFVREADGTDRIVAITGSAAIREAVKAAERDAARTVPTEQQPTPQPQRESAPTPSPADPGIDHRPAHPDQAKLDDVRERVEQLHAQHGLSLTPQQADNGAAALLLNMTKSGGKEAARVDFSVHATTQQVNPQGNLIVYAHYPLREYSATAAVPVHVATSSPAEASLRELKDVKQQHAERDLAWQQQRERANAQEQLHGPGPMAFG